MPFFVVPVLLFATALFAVEQEQPTPYDLIRPIWPMAWDTAATDDGGTVQSFSQYVPNAKKHNTVPPIGAKPQDFVANGLIPDTLNQAFRDAQNLRIGRIRVNQAGYLPDDPEMQFYYISDGSCTETYSVVDLNDNEVATGGTFTSSGLTTTSSWDIKAGTDAATNNQGRYTSSADAPSGTVCIGNLVQVAGNLSLDTRYRIKVLKQRSSTFIISPRVYSMVRDALLKFYGVNRSGNSESWFHKPSHTKDGGGPVVNNITAGAATTVISPKEGDLQGGWYDCGDHLKESYTQAYAFMVLAITAAGNPDRDDDNYAYNHGETVNTDGIPDILREAKHGADYFLRAYRIAGGIVDNMPVSVGNFGADHGWWGRPENQDALPATLKGRGGPHERDVRLGELGANVSSEIAAGLAILGKEYAIYDKAFADSCKMAAIAIYDFARALALDQPTYGDGLSFVNNKEKGEWGTPAYSGSNSYIDDISIAAIALHYGTYDPKNPDMKYLNDAVEDKTIGTDQEPGVGFFRGGWMAAKRDGMRKSSNTDWANVQTYALYGFYKLLLKNDSISTAFGISHDDRLWYAENVAFMLANNVAARSGSGSTSIPIPNPSDGTKNVSASDLWYQMQTQMAWIYNRYQAGNIFDVFAYADVTKDLEGVKLPQKGVQPWNSAKMKQLGINQLNYLFGVNPWDISFMIGVGDKSDNHPHHRAANPEGKNMPGAGYSYKPPVGALFGGVPPEGDNEWTPSTLSWEDYFKSETCIDATAMFLAAASAAIKEEDRNRAPSDIKVEIRYAGYDNAIIKVGQDVRGPAMILYSTNETGPFNIPAKDTVNSVNHEFNLTGLKNGTTYYFKVISVNARSEAYTTKWLVDSTSTPFSFTTLVSPQGDANMQNIKICNLTADTAEVMWYTPNGQYGSKVYWDTELKPYDQMTCPGTAGGNCDIVGTADISGIPTSFHYVKFGKLNEKTTYFYCVESDGVVVCNNDKGQPLKFTTPVTRYNFDVSVYQYEFGGMDFLNLNLINNEDRAFDNIELRLYVTATPEQIEAVPGENNQPGTCPLLIDSDICQAYDEAGFNRPCVNGNGENVDDSLRYYLRHAVPKKLDDTYNPLTGEYDWYIPIPLGGTMIKSSSRMRVDVGFSSGIYQNNMCETLRTPGKKRFIIPNTKDWTWRAHAREIDGADFAGVPAWDKDQGDIEQAPVNPYIAVYRKGEFISGFSPSYQEMVTKRANYEITMAFDAPFNVSNGSYIKLDSTISTMHVRGNAFVSESGYITDIWVNGVALTREQLATAAVYDQATGRYTLDIPAKMSIGTNKVDITVFAGPNPECAECQENGGCAFVNRSYFVQFSKGDRTAGKIQLLREDGSSVSSPVEEDPMKFKVFVSDKDNNGRESINVTLRNSRSGDTTRVTLKRTDPLLGYFESEWLSAVNNASVSLPKISLLGGDTVYVIYVDVEDPEDSTAQSFYANPTTPIPQLASLADTDCDSKGDVLSITFSGSQFDGSRVKLDYVVVDIDSAKNAPAVSLKVLPTTTVVGATATFVLDQSLMYTNAAPTGKVTIYMTETGVEKTAEKTITDGIFPTLVSVAMLENEDRAANPQDTIKIAFSEPVNLSSTTTWPLEISKMTEAGLASVPQEGIKVISATTTDEGKSWLYVIEGNDGSIVAKDYKAVVKAGFTIADMSTNPLSDCNGAVTIIESVRPVPVKFATITDFEGDGNPDEIYIEFTKVLRDKDMLDTIDVYWGTPDIYKAFAMPAGGWMLDTVAGDTIFKKLTEIDSSTGSWNVIVKESCDYVDTMDSVFKNVVIRDSLGDSIGTRREFDYLKPNTIKTNCKKTQDSTFIPGVKEIGVDTVQAEHTVIRIAMTDDTYNMKTGGSRNGNGMILPRQGPLGGFFDENTAALYDKCAPVIVSAKLTVEEGIDRLKVTTSEPVQADSAEFLYYIERKRGGVGGVYLESATRVTINGSTQSYIYFDDAPDAVHTADSIRLAPMEKARFKDAAGNLPTERNPWKIVSGDASNTRFKVTMETGFSKSTGDASVYGNFPPEPDEAFRISYKKDDSETIGTLMDGILTVGSKNIGSDYAHGGPTFDLEISLPVLLMTDSVSGGDLYDVSVKFSFSVYDNMGQFINKQTVSIEPNTVRKVAAEDGTLRLSLEWLAQDGDAPISAAGKKIATGAYIAKFDFKSTATNVRTGDVQKSSDDATKTFGFKRAKR